MCEHFRKYFDTKDTEEKVSRKILVSRKCIKTQIEMRMSKSLSGARFPNMKTILYMRVLVKCDNYQKIQVHEKSSEFSSHVKIFHVQNFQNFESLYTKLPNTIYHLIISCLEKKNIFIEAMEDVRLRNHLTCASLFFANFKKLKNHGFYFFANLKS